jgi:crotonobetainyl-CoA:carnitine CoA-transferase CaiB-like acyl-CoA transferase
MRVVEMAQGVAGPMAACRLGDLGAELVKVERGEGDWMRAAVPTLSQGEMSAAFAALNRGKKSLLLDAPGAPEKLEELLRGADVLIVDESFDDVLAARRAPLPASLIVADISALGRKGPMAGRPGSELCVQAMAGYTRYVGSADRPAARLGADVAGASTAIFAVQAILAALLARASGGKGQRVELTLLGSLLAMKTVHLAAQSDPDEFEGPRVGGAYDPPERGWATKDAPITFAFGGAVGAEGRPGWTQFVEAVGLKHLLDDPRFDKSGRQTTGLGPRARELKAEYEAAFRQRTSSEIVAAVRRYGGFASAYLAHAELMREEQVAALDVVRSVPQGTGVVPALAFPVRFSAGEPNLSGHAPSLGEHTREILGGGSDPSR